MEHVSEKGVKGGGAEGAVPVSEAGTAGEESAPGSSQQRVERSSNKIHVSREKKSLSFFLKLTKKFLRNHEEVELSGLGLAITTVITITEILKANGHVTVRAMNTSLADLPERDESSRESTRAAGPSVGGRTSSLPKAKIQVWIERSENFFDLIAREQEREEARVAESSVATGGAGGALVDEGDGGGLDDEAEGTTTERG